MSFYTNLLKWKVPKTNSDGTALVGIPPELLSRSKRGRQFGGVYGRRIALWSGASLQNSGGTAALVSSSDLPWRTDGATKYMQLTQNATESFGQQICESSDYISPSAAIPTVGLWINNPSGAHLSCEFRIYNTAANKTAAWNFTVAPTGGWQFLTIAPTSVAFNNLTWGTDEVHYVRISQRNAGGDVWPTGAVCQFGNVYMGSKGRARFMLCADDGIYSILRPQDATTGFPASGNTIVEILEYYGFKGTLYIIPPLVGQSGRITQSELLRLQDEGWSIGSHADADYAYSSRGLRSLGPTGYADPSDTYHALATNDDTAIYSAIMAGVEGLRALGIHHPDWLFSLPQGAWDSYVRSAVIRSGVKHVRGISSYNNYHTVGIGMPAGGGNSASTLHLGGWMHQADAIQTDSALTNGNIETYVDNVIAYGATGANYHHGVTTSNAASLDHLCSYLKTQQDAGLIEVVTGYQAAFDDGLLE